LNNLRNVKS